jgi:two-component system response regulator AtoC
MLKPPHKLVIIDDEAEVLEIMAEVVKHLFHDQVQIVTFASSREAWEYILHNEIRIVLSDLHLPDIHGLDLVRQVIGLNRGIQVIAVTGDKSSSAALECFMNGVHGYICKPATMQKVQDTLTQCLSQLSYWRRIIESSEEV